MGRKWLYLCLAMMLTAVNIAGCSGGSTVQNSAAEGTTQAAAPEKEPPIDGTALPADARIAIAVYPGEGSSISFMNKYVERTRQNLESAGIPAEQIEVREATNGSDELLACVEKLIEDRADVVVVGNADRKAAEEISPQITDRVMKTGAALLYFGAMPSQEEQDRWVKKGWKVTCVGSDLSKVGEMRAQILDSIDFDDVDANEDHHITVGILNTEEDSEGNEANRISIDALESYHYTVELINGDEEDEDNGEDTDNGQNTDDDRDNADTDADADKDDADTAAGADRDDADTDENGDEDGEDDEDKPDIDEVRYEAAREQVTAWINDYGKDLEVILSADDALTRGALDALDDFSRKVGHDVIVIGFSPDQESLEKISHGELAGSIFNDSLAQSKNLSDAILAYLRGETVPAQILCDYVKVTADNAQEIMDVSKMQDDDSDEDDGEGDDSEDNDNNNDNGDNE